MKFSYLYIIFFFLINHLQSDDLKVYNIGFLDIKEDMRYSKWGIHPVDIRSKLNKNILLSKIPVLGICFGHQIISKEMLSFKRFLLDNMAWVHSGTIGNRQCGQKCEK